MQRQQTLLYAALGYKLYRFHLFYREWAVLVWAVASQKGGVGKTTTVASIAGWLQKENLRVLVVDTDPHASLTSYLGIDDERIDQNNLFDLYAMKTPTREGILRCITKTAHEGLDLISASMTLATIDRHLSGRQGVGRILSRSLSLIEDCYDVVLIDCPPVLGALMVNALVAATTIIVPTQTEFLALKGLEGMVRTFTVMQRANKSVHFDYTIIPTMYDRRTKASVQSLSYLKTHYRDHIWRGSIPIDISFRESSARRLPLPIMDDSRQGSVAYRNLLKSLIESELERHPDRVSENLKDVGDAIKLEMIQPKGTVLRCLTAT